MRLYCIYDRVSKRFNAPFVAESDEVANRSFQYGLKNQPFASDMDLYSVGTFDPETETNLPLIGDFARFVSHFVGEVIDNG